MTNHRVFGRSAATLHLQRLRGDRLRAGGTGFIGVAVGVVDVGIGAGVVDVTVDFLNFPFILEKTPF